MSSAPATEPLDRRTRRGALAMYAAQVGSQIVSLVSLAILARLVAPEYFGLVGIVMPFVMLPRMVATLGFSAATVQHADENPAVLSGLFWHTWWWSLAAGALTMLISPLVGWVYEIQYAVPVSFAFGIATVIQGLSTIPLAVLERQLKFTTSAMIRLASQSIAAISAIAIAWNGREVEALVAQHVIEIAFLTALGWKFSNWRPLAARDSEIPRATRNFGHLYSLSMVVFFAAQNVDRLILGLWLSGSEQGRALLGMYTQAFNLVQRVVLAVTNPLGVVVLSTLSRLGNSLQQRTEWVERFYLWAALALLPASAGVCVVAPDAMLLIAPRWPEAGGILRALSPMLAALGFINISCLVLASQAKSGSLLFAALLQFVLMLQAVIFGSMIDTNLTPEPSLAEAQSWLTTTIAWAVSLTNLFVFLIPFLVFVLLTSNTPVLQFIRAIRVPLIGAVTMVAALLAFPPDRFGVLLEPWARLLFQIVLGASVYGNVVGILLLAGRKKS